MVGIIVADWLCEHRQCPRHRAVMMPEAVAFMMQHESHPVGPWFKNRAVIGINRSQQRRCAHTDGRERNYVQQQPAPASKLPDETAVVVLTTYIHRMNTGILGQAMPSPQANLTKNSKKPLLSSRQLSLRARSVY